MYSGGFGSGKSTVLCWKAIQHASIPNNLVLLCRKSRAAMMQSTLRTLKELLIPGTYEIQESKSIININGGGQIYFTGFDDEYKIRSINAGCICVDEGIEITEDEYLTLISRVRNVSDNHRQLAIVTNPSGKNHYLWKRYFSGSLNTEVIQASTLDNYHLPKDYIERLKTLPDVEYRRNVLGEWCSPENLCIYEFNRDKHVINCDDKYDNYLISIDPGYTDPTALLLIGIKDKQYFVIDEFYASGCTNSDIIKFLDKYKPLNPKLIIDPSSASFIAELATIKYNVEKANNSVDQGILTLNDCFKNNKLFIDVKCKNLINSLELYAYKLNSEIPEHQYSHACDSLRYAQMYLVGNKIYKPSIFYKESKVIEQEF